MKALIFGVTGQDGSYLAEFLLSKGYKISGTVRRSSSINTGRIDHIFDRINLLFCDLSDGGAVRSVIDKVKPDEIYGLGAQSHVRVSFDIPEYTLDVTGLGTLRVLEAIRDINPKVKYYQASSSELFGSSPAPQNEDTPFHPRSPYGIAKIAAYWTTVNYRESYGIFAVNGLLFNHESPRRGETFVTRKIAKAVANIVHGKQSELLLGNLDSKRDWGYAPEYVDAMWRMLQQDEPRDLVIATGETHTVREFVDEAFKYVGLDYQDYVRFDPKYLRPAEVDILCGDASRAEKYLGWKPRVKFSELVRIMVDAEMSKHELVGR